MLRVRSETSTTCKKDILKICNSFNHSRALKQDKLLARCLEEVSNANSQLGRDLPRLQEMPQHCIQLDSLGVPGADLVHLIGDAADEGGKHLIDCSALRATFVLTAYHADRLGAPCARERIAGLHHLLYDAVGRSQALKTP